MPKRSKMEMRSVLAGLVSVPMAISAMATPAPAHEWIRWDRKLAYPYSERDPSDPNVGVAASSYRPVTRDLGSFRPMDPLPWGEVNRRVMPIPKPPPKEKGQ